MDADLCGPSIPKLLNCDHGSVYQSDEGWIPVFPLKNDSLAVMSIGFLLKNESDPVIWRGPKKNMMIKQFIQDVCWGEIDFLIVDTPPGTSDEHMAVVESTKDMNPDGAVLVTTPQRVAANDVRREITFCKKTGLPVIGIIENMSGLKCPNCSSIEKVFSMGGGEELAKENNLNYLGRLPLDPEFASACEDGRLLNSYSTLNAFEQWNPILDAILAKCLDQTTTTQ